jgi:hypothetical protein
MNKKSFYVKGLYALVLCLVLVGIFVFGMSFIEKGSKVESVNNQQSEIKVFNKTSAFEVIKSEIVGDELQLSLKNISNKGINAFQVLVGPEKGDSLGSFVDFIYSDIKDEISPNEVFVHREALGKEIYANGITLQAVFFTDGTGDGEANIIREVNETRQGTSLQLSKGLEMIQKTLASPSDEFSSRVIALRTEISDLPAADKTKSPQYNSGLHFGKERLLTDIKNIESNKQDLIKVESKLKKVIPRLSQTPKSEKGGRS